MNNLFLLFHSPKPQSHVGILIYRKWPINTITEPQFFSTPQTELYNEMGEKMNLRSLSL